MMWQKITCPACNGKGKSFWNTNDICSSCGITGTAYRISFPVYLPGTWKVLFYKESISWDPPSGNMPDPEGT